jgi:hypothetical protein
MAYSHVRRVLHRVRNRSNKSGARSWVCLVVLGKPDTGSKPGPHRTVAKRVHQGFFILFNEFFKNRGFQVGESIMFVYFNGRNWDYFSNVVVEFLPGTGGLCYVPTGISGRTFESCFSLLNLGRFCFFQRCRTFQVKVGTLVWPPRTRQGYQQVFIQKRGLPTSF